MSLPRIRQYPPGAGQRTAATRQRHCGRTPRSLTGAKARSVSSFPAHNLPEALSWRGWPDIGRGSYHKARRARLARVQGALSSPR
jgi:hypothetical protein